MKNKALYAKKKKKIAEIVHSRSILPENMCGETLSRVSASSSVSAKADALRRRRDTDWFICCNYFIHFHLHITFHYWKPAVKPFQFLISFL